MTRAEDKRMVAIRIEPELIEWFDAAFPIRGAKQWFFEGSLRQLKELYDRGEFEPPVDLLNLTVREVVKDL